MRDADFEQKFLEFVYETDQVITTGAIAYHLKIPIEESDNHLQRLAGRGVITLESDDSGNLFYEYPNRPKGKLRAPQNKRLTSGSDARAPAPPAPQQVVHVGGHGQTGGGPVLRPVLRADGTAACPVCAEEIKPNARKCKHCGEVFDPALRRAQPVQVNVGLQPYQSPHPPTYTGQHSPGTAALLSFLIPGVGQMYCGRIGVGVGWLIGTLLGYMFLFVPGFVAHIACIVNAANTARET